MASLASPSTAAIVIIRFQDVVFQWGEPGTPSLLTVSLEEPFFLISYLLDPFIAIMHWVFRVGVGEQALVLHFRESCDDTYWVFTKKCSDTFFTNKIRFAGQSQFKAALDIFRSKAEDDMGSEDYESIVYADGIFS